ncbi:MAG: PepSY domain-containing protein [Xanthobacteraceae bacterium]
MKKTSMTIAAAMLAASTATSLADQTPGADWMTADKVIQKLMEKGYTNISKLEADDGRWEAKATLNGARQKVYLDPRSGEVVGQKPTR